MQGHDRRYLVLAAMVFSVAMMFVDQTIVAIAAPNIQRSLSLSATGTQWMINSYLLALAALIALGGKISDVFGHRRMVIAGTVGFAAASALCGAAPHGSLAVWWLIAFRVLQGASGAVLFPAALAIVVDSFEPGERGRALAIYFGVTGALTSIGPIGASLLLPWTWRAIDQVRSNVVSSLTKAGVPHSIASHVAAEVNAGAGAASGGPPSHGTHGLLATVEHNFAQSTRTVFIAMAILMAVSLMVALRGMQRGIPEEVASATPQPLAEAE